MELTEFMDLDLLQNCVGRMGKTDEVKKKEGAIPACISRSNKSWQIGSRNVVWQVEWIHAHDAIELVEGRFH